MLTKLIYHTDTHVHTKTVNRSDSSLKINSDVFIDEIRFFVLDIYFVTQKWSDELTKCVILKRVENGAI